MRTFIVAAFAFSAVAFAQAQGPFSSDTVVQVGYAANLQTPGIIESDSFINLTNTGASNGAPLLGPGFGGAVGNICVNVFAFSPDEQLVSCCSCHLTPNSLWVIAVNRYLLKKTLTGVQPSSVVIKLVATVAGDRGTGGPSTCNNSAASFGIPANGLLAWRTTLHPGPTGGWETTVVPLRPVTPHPGDLISIFGRCASILGNGSGFGQCDNCRLGGFGAAAK